MRAYVDHVLAVLPFETGGLPPAERPALHLRRSSACSKIDALRPIGQEPRRQRGLAAAACWCLPGSRRSEIKRNMTIFGEALRLLRSQGVMFEPVLPTTPALLESVRAAAEGWPVQARIVVSDADKQAAFRTARAALAKSGTVTSSLHWPVCRW